MLKGRKFSAGKRIRNEEYNADMAAYMRLISEQNTTSETVSLLKKNLAIAFRTELTPKQRKYMLLYYGENMKMHEIAKMFGVDKSTISRTITRGEHRLQRCLCYGAESLITKAFGKITTGAVLKTAKARLKMAAESQTNGKS